MTIKEHLGYLSLLSKPIKWEKLYLYLAVSEDAVSATLVRDKKKVQWLVYYVSKRLIDAETRYLELEKLALTLIVESRKLRPYFHTHPIEVLTKYPLMLQKLKASGRLFKWVIELG